MNRMFLITISAIFLMGCVSKKKFNELSGDKNEIGIKYSKLKSDHEQLSRDHKKLGNDLETCNATNKKNEEALKDLQSRYDQLFSNSEKDAGKLSDLQYDLKVKEATLQAKEERIKELESLVNRKDSAANALMDNLRNALIAFEDDELSIELKQGVVYVSLSDKLLYKSGSVDVEKRAVEALGKVADVIKKNQDVDVMILGHTDDVPIKTGCFKDNWDLSVSRATAVSRILIWKYEVAAERITASGKGEYEPIASNESAEGRKLNRRTEIILTPRLDELFKLLNVANE